MATLTHFGRLLSLVLWVGGIAFFAFAVAPVAFSRLPNAHEAGLVVGGTLRVLHGLGLVCGFVFVGLTLAIARRIASRRLVSAELALALGMLAITAYSQFRVLPAMDVFRAQAGGDIAIANLENAARVHFEDLHKLSERLEGTVLLGGITLLFAFVSEHKIVRTLDS